ncbi:hypothetical protein TCAL_14261 [Tigriopus californicus]|uniref:Apple domain-containing protein n=1 Tax=Tigriopus californicus TaxID=6832 RepID=A0A553NSJ4_TIGCA|nr:hypothetical protein TCAL_14261 [Tigriopus californicus]
MRVEVIFPLLAVIPVTLGIDLCILFNTCRDKRPGRNFFQQSNPVDRSGETGALIIDTDWIESEAIKNDQLYHFASNAGPMDWFQASRYCESKGGFLAEPITTEEHQFLRGQARQYPNVIWWIGLREAQNCRCQPPSRTSNPFIAKLDQSSLLDPNGGYVKSRCVDGFNLICSGVSWKWASSGTNVGATQWNPSTNEPNSNLEHCVTLWARENYNWADWSCKVSTEGGQTFKPVCQKDKLDHLDYAEDDYEDDYDYDYSDDNKDKEPRDIDEEEEDDYYYEDDDGGKDGDYGPSANLESNEAECVEQNIRYRFRPDDQFETFSGVSSFENCQLQCAGNPACQFWTWKGNRRAKQCILSRGVRNENNFKVGKEGFVSGRMNQVCKDSLPTREKGQTGRNVDFCVEYGALYRNGNQLRVIRNVPSVEDCRMNCETINGCQFYSWNGNAKNQQCWLFSDTTFETRFRRGAISGSLLGECQGKSLDELQACECTNLIDEDPEDPKDPEDYDYDYRDLVGEGLIDVRLNVQRSARMSRKCRGRKAVQRCSVGQAERPIEREINHCVDYEVLYRGGTQIKATNGLVSAEACKAQCKSNARCRFFSWNGQAKNQRCFLLANADFEFKSRRGAVSGSVEGECRQALFSDMQECTCVNLQDDNQKPQEQEFEDYDYKDLVGEGLIDVRLNNPSACPRKNARRCTLGSNGGGPKPRDIDYCVEYNALYRKGSPLRPVKNANTLDECRQMCQSAPNCNFYSWNAQGKNKKCFLFPEMDFDVVRRSGATSGNILGECSVLNFPAMSKCDCVDAPVNKEETDGQVDEDDDDEEDTYYYEDRDLVGEGLIDVRVNLGGGECQNKIRRCSKGTEEPQEQKEVCVDYNTQYQGGQVLERFNRIANQDVCRAKCIQTPGCQYWQYKGSIRSQACLVMSSDPNRMKYQSGFVSGSLIGECRNLALSQLRDCECYDHENDRLPLGPTTRTLSDSDCAPNIGLRCYSKNADIIVSRVFFGN